MRKNHKRFCAVLLSLVMLLSLLPTGGAAAGESPDAASAAEIMRSVFPELIALEAEAEADEADQALILPYGQHTTLYDLREGFAVTGASADIPSGDGKEAVSTVYTGGGNHDGREETSVLRTWTYYKKTESAASVYGVNNDPCAADLSWESGRGLALPAAISLKGSSFNLAADFTVLRGYEGDFTGDGKDEMAYLIGARTTGADSYPLLLLCVGAVTDSRLSVLDVLYDGRAAGVTESVLFSDQLRWSGSTSLVCGDIDGDLVDEIAVCAPTNFTTRTDGPYHFDQTAAPYFYDLTGGSSAWKRATGWERQQKSNMASYLSINYSFTGAVGATNSMAVGDVDGDGYADIVFACSTTFTNPCRSGSNISHCSCSDLFLFYGSGDGSGAEGMTMRNLRNIARSSFGNLQNSERTGIGSYFNVDSSAVSFDVMCADVNSDGRDTIFLSLKEADWRSYQADRNVCTYAMPRYLVLAMDFKVSDKNTEAAQNAGRTLFDGSLVYEGGVYTEYNSALEHRNWYIFSSDDYISQLPVRLGYLPGTTGNREPQREDGNTVSGGQLIIDEHLFHFTCRPDGNNYLYSLDSPVHYTKERAPAQVDIAAETNEKFTYGYFPLETALFPQNGLYVLQARSGHTAMTVEEDTGVCYDSLALVSVAYDRSEDYQLHTIDHQTKLEYVNSSFGESGYKKEIYRDKQVDTYTRVAAKSPMTTRYGGVFRFSAAVGAPQTDVRFMEVGNNTNTFPTATETASMAGVAVAMPNLDSDSVTLDYRAHRFVWTDPQIVVALASPPYFGALPSDNYQNGGTAYGESYSQDNDMTYEVSLSTTSFTSVSMKGGFVGASLAVTEEASTGSGVVSGLEFSRSYTTSLDVETPGGEDTIVLSTTAYDIFVYDLTYPLRTPDSSGNTSATTHYIVHVPRGGSQSMVIATLSAEQYMELRQYAEATLPDVSTIFTHTLGDPSSYPASIPEAQNGSYTLSDVLVSRGTQTFPAGNGAWTLSLEEATSASDSTSSTRSYSHATSGGLGYEGELDKIAFSASLELETGTEVSQEFVSGASISKSYSSCFSGTVCGQDDGMDMSGGVRERASFNWQLMKYTYRDLYQDFPVVTYLVRGVNNPLGVTPDQVDIAFYSAAIGADPAHYTVQQPNAFYGELSTDRASTATITVNVAKAADNPRPASVWRRTNVQMELPDGLTAELPEISADGVCNFRVHAGYAAVPGAVYPLQLVVGGRPSNTIYLHVTGREDPGYLVTDTETERICFETVGSRYQEALGAAAAVSTPDAIPVQIYTTRNLLLADRPYTDVTASLSLGADSPFELVSPLTTDEARPQSGSLILEYGVNAALSIRPREGLEAGTYEDVLIVGSRVSNLQIPVSFTVAQPRRPEIRSAVLLEQNHTSALLDFALESPDDVPVTGYVYTIDGSAADDNGQPVWQAMTAEALTVDDDSGEAVTGTAYRISGLTAGAETQLRIRAVTAYGESAEFAYTLHTPAYGVPDDVHISYRGLEPHPVSLTVMVYDDGGTGIQGFRYALTDPASRYADPASLDWQEAEFFHQDYAHQYSVGIGSAAAGGEYALALRAYNAQGESAPVWYSFSVNTATVPTPVRNAAVNWLEDGLAVTWDEPEDSGDDSGFPMMYYVGIYARNPYSGDYDNRLWFSDWLIGETTLIRDGLSALPLTVGETYEIVIHAQNAGEKFSRVSLLTVCGADTAPVRPSALTAEPSYGRIDLSWEASLTPGAAYEVTLDGGQTWLPVGTALEWYETGFSVGQELTCGVRGVNAHGAGAPRCCTVTIPSDLSEVDYDWNYGSEQLDFCWTPQTDIPVTGYQYRLDDGDWVDITDRLYLFNGQLHFVLRGLINQRWYQFSLRAYNSEGFGPAEPRGISTYSVGWGSPLAESICLEARDGKAVVCVAGDDYRPYSIYYCLGGEGNEWQSAWLDYDRNELPITNLENGRTYTIALSTDFSSEHSCRTYRTVTPQAGIAEPPVPVRSPEVGAIVGDDHITVSWQVEEDFGFPVTGFVVTCGSYDTSEEALCSDPAALQLPADAASCTLDFLSPADMAEIDQVAVFALNEAGESAGYCYVGDDVQFSIDPVLSLNAGCAAQSEPIMLYSVWPVWGWDEALQEDVIVGFEKDYYYEYDLELRDAPDGFTLTKSSSVIVMYPGEEDEYEQEVDAYLLNIPAGLPAGTYTLSLAGGRYSFEEMPFGQFRQKEITIVVSNAPVITADALPAGLLNSAYHTDALSADIRNAAWTVVDGVLPGGITLNAATGILDGICAESGSFTFTVRAENSYGADEKCLTLTVTDDGDLLHAAEADGELLTVTFHTNADEAVLAVSSYAADGRLLAATFHSLTPAERAAGTAAVRIDPSRGESLRVMLLDGLTSLRPLCPALSIAGNG